jgi:alanyl-tRNA synthetase
MRSLSTDDIRQEYLDFFQRHDHAVISGASLIPENDPTVLFTTAGMHPLVPYLIGEPHPSGKRLVDVQRCIRTQDIDEVGDTSHLTMFEMLGNWSLGDYFKKEAIEMSFKFLTEVLEIPVERIGVTCFRGDDDAPKDEEAAKYWEEVGIPKNRIGFLPKEDNWWGPAGQTGPCGPDTEIFVWMGDGDPQGNPETHPENWLEVWNDVFMQYMKKEAKEEKEYVFEPLAQKNVDTGMGLERIAAVLQGVATVYDTDRMMPIVNTVTKLAKNQDEKHIRIIVDHLKAATFIIADGITPSNVDQGYVLRRLIRRAIRSARTLGIEQEKSFTPIIADEVIKQYGQAFNQLKDRANEIRTALDREEQQFKKALTEGLKQFEKAADSSEKMIDGTTAFHLYDTYGFPIEMTKELAKERGMSVDEAGFEKEFASHQEKSRSGADKKFAGGLADQSSETTKLHTAAHLLNGALRKVLGDHVFQKGSNITAERLRFDFSHDTKMTDEEKKAVEDLVNKAIEDDLPVTYHVTSVDDAKSEGAVGVFDDRYGSEVKVYTVGDEKEGTVFGKEICGGPHVSRTGVLGNFRIQKESSSSAGVRRIKAVLEGGEEKIEIAELGA